MNILVLVKGIIIIAFLYLVIGLVWMVGEKLIYGHIQSRFIDDIVAVILAISIYFNMKG